MKNNHRHGDWIQTVTGKQFWPFDPRPEDIDIEDIAHALSMQCRFAGHCIRFYSVAEHSVLLSETLSRKRDALWALLHDASEAYLVDIPRPIKPYLFGYYEAEEALMKAIAIKFDLEDNIPEIVKQRDYQILFSEAEQNMSKPPASWTDYGKIEPLDVKLQYWSPEEAKKKFLDRYYQLRSVGRPVNAAVC